MRFITNTAHFNGIAAMKVVNGKQSQYRSKSGMSCGADGSMRNG